MRQADDEWTDGIRYIKVPAQAYISNTGLLRLVNHWQLGKRARTSIKQLCRQSKPDIIICASPPLYWCHSILKTAGELGIKSVLDIQDNWPAALQSVQPFLYKTTLDALPFQILLKRNISMCTALTAVSSEFLPAMPVKPSKVFYLGAPVAGIMQYMSLQKPVKASIFTLVFLGHIGTHHALASFLQNIKDEDEVQIKVIGQCSDPRIRMHPRVVYKGPLYAGDLYGELASAHYGLFIDDSYKEIRMPNKLFYYWACGLPVLGIKIKGEAAQWIETLQGVNSDTLPLDINFLKQHLSEINTAEIQKLALENFDTDKIYTGFARFISSL